MKPSTALFMALATAASLTTITPAEAFNPGQLAQLKSTNSCSRCDLTFAPLERATLNGAMLESAALTSANLKNAKLNSARLSYAMLSEANLSGADLSNANLENAQLMGAQLSGTVLTGANLSWATWTDGSTCDEGSIGQCKKVSDKNKK